MVALGAAFCQRSGVLSECHRSTPSPHSSSPNTVEVVGFHQGFLERPLSVPHLSDELLPLEFKGRSKASSRIRQRSGPRRLADYQGRRRRFGQPARIVLPILDHASGRHDPANGLFALTPPRPIPRKLRSCYSNGTERRDDDGESKQMRRALHVRFQGYSWLIRRESKSSVRHWRSARALTRGWLPRRRSEAAS
jgi:hypothetical protein